MPKDATSCLQDALFPPSAVRSPDSSEHIPGNIFNLHTDIDAF